MNCRCSVEVAETLGAAVRVGVPTTDKVSPRSSTTLSAEAADAATLDTEAGIASRPWNDAPVRTSAGNSPCTGTRSPWASSTAYDVLPPEGPSDCATRRVGATHVDRGEAGHGRRDAGERGGGVGQPQSAGEQADPSHDPHVVSLARQLHRRLGRDPLGEPGNGDELTFEESARDDVAALHLDRDLRQGCHRAGGAAGRAGHVAAVGDGELAAVAGAVDGARGDARERAPLVGAGGRG